MRRPQPNSQSTTGSRGTRLSLMSAQPPTERFSELKQQTLWEQSSEVRPIQEDTTGGILILILDLTAGLRRIIWLNTLFCHPLISLFQTEAINQSLKALQEPLNQQDLQFLDFQQELQHRSHQPPVLPIVRLRSQSLLAPQPQLETQRLSLP